MRGRLIAILIALAALAFVASGDKSQAPPAQRHGHPVADLVGKPQAPAPDAPAIITAALKTSATVQTLLGVESRRELNPALTVSTARPHVARVTFSAGKPRSFPLLI